MTDVLHQIVTHIRAKTSDRANILFTVAPMPLHGTFTPRDVICANLYSKASLLSAAVNIAGEYGHVDDYPSYEMITMANPESTWEDDGAQVKPALVERVIGKFLESYVS